MYFVYIRSIQSVKLYKRDTHLADPIYNLYMLLWEDD